MHTQFDLLSSFAKWIICTSKVDPPIGDGMFIQVFVNGVDMEIDFNKLVVRVAKDIDLEVEERANQIVYEKYDDLIQDIENTRAKFGTEGRW